MIDAKSITVDDLSPLYQRISEILGIDAAIKLGLEYGGQQLLFPKLDSALRKVRDRQIMDEYINSTSTIRQLCKKYQLSERQIHHIIKK